MIAESMGATVLSGEWHDEQVHREAVLSWAIEQGIEHLLIPDSDEIFSQELLLTLRKIATVDLADVVHCTMDTYWKSPEYVIRPRERLMPVIMLKPKEVRYEYIREFKGKRPLALPPEQGVLHHLSYAGPDERIQRKIRTWSHRDEIVPDWEKRIWGGWNSNRTMGSLHPTHPDAYRYAERILVPSEVAPAWDSYVEACGGRDPLHDVEASAELSGTWPKVSVVIPLYGGEDDIRLCLDSLSKCLDLIHEVIVVDDVSPDEAPTVAKEFDFVKFHQNDQNFGFAKTCNVGASLSTGEVLLFLNSDTVVPRIGLHRLISSLMKSGSIGAAGPSTNEAGHYQRVPVTYSSIDHVDLFAEDIACNQLEDLEVDMLVAFCLAVRRSVWDEVGTFDERFKIGMFEDNDLCYRIRRAGYRLMFVQSSFVHHKGSASLDRSQVSRIDMFNQNLALYRRKWAMDLETGFVSQLAGLQGPRISFNESRRPESLSIKLASKVKEASLSLCMIVKNESRVLADCLRSAKPFFSQIIVVDTGSSDDTIQIAKEFGAEVVEFPWPDSFALARNESLRHAKGDWVCWLDADDTLPFSSGEQIIDAVLSVPPQIGGLVVPIRFVNDDPEFGTQVDHVKVFRNKQGFFFEGRIHEQVLPSIREKGFDVTRIGAEVLHTGYDVSEEGQARKRERDSKLLKLDLEDRPNHPFVLFNLGMTAHFNGDHEEASKWLENSIFVAQNGESHIRKAYALWAVSQREMGRPERALEIVQRGIAEVGQDPELFFHQGMLQTNLGNLEAAVESYRRVLAVERSSFFSSVDSGIFGYKTFHNLAGVHLQLGNIEAAIANFKLAMNSNPRYLHSAFDLFRLSLDLSDWSTAEACLSHVERIDGISSNARVMRDQLSARRNGHS